MNFSSFKHSYELDVVEIYLEHVKRVRHDLRLSYFERNSRVQSLKYAVEAVLKSHRIHPKKVIEDRYAVLILPENDPDSFDYWFALYLSILPTYKIELVLEYYYRRLSFSDQYLDKLEFFVINIIEKDPHLFNVELLERLSGWIHGERAVDYTVVGNSKIKEPSETELDSNSEKVNSIEKNMNRKLIHINRERFCRVNQISI